MGLWQSTQRGTEEEEDVSTSSQYRYPPKAGSFFSSHFIMGGEKFDSQLPESFLFGENSDLNYLGSKPVPFPYPPPQANEPTKTLKALVNIRRDSLHFTKVKTEDGEEDPGKYNIVFTMDADVRTSITMYYLATEELNCHGPVYSPKREVMCSPTYMYRKGAGQQFIQEDHIFQPGLYEGEGLDGSVKDLLPVVIHCVAEEGEEPRQSHVTIGVIDKHSDGIYALKTFKQKLFVDGLCYLLQEIYGVERKGADEVIDEEIDDTGAECVVCMCDSRDTLILPCRHLCLCNACADSLRYQANNCPICRAPFRALLQIRALQKTGHSATHPALAGESQPEGVPQGYELVSLVEALNGPLAQPPPAAAPLSLTETEGGKKKKTKRRGSREQHAAAKDKRAGSEKSFSPPPVEDPDSLPAPPPTPPIAGAAGGDVTIIDEKEGRGSLRSLNKLKNGNPDEDSHKIKLEVVSQSSVRSAEQDVVEEELARLKIGKEMNEEEEEEEEDVKEPTTEDELLKDEKREEEETFEPPEYVPDFPASDQEDDEDEQNVEVVSLRAKNAKAASVPGSPSSVGSLRSSQESSTSVNSSKQLLDAKAGGQAEGDEKLAVPDKKKEFKRRSKACIAPLEE